MSKTVYILHSPFDFSFSHLRVWLRIEFLIGNVNILETLLSGPAASVSVGTSKAVLLLCDLLLSGSLPLFLMLGHFPKRSLLWSVFTLFGKHQKLVSF